VPLTVGSPTVTEAVALAEPEVTVIVAVPTATAVTRPVDDTVAVVAADVAHVTAAPLIVALFWSLTVADSWDVTPTESKLRPVSERVTDVATGVGVVVVVGVVGLPSPPQLAKSSENKLHAINFFMPLFCPAPLSSATQDAQNSVHRFSVSDAGIGCTPLGSRLSAKGTRTSYQIFFGERRCSGVDVCRPAPVPPRGRQ